MSAYETALEQLRYPATWCKGAKTLAKMGNRQDLIPLLRAYEKPVEARKDCLLNAMQALDPKLGAAELCDSRDDEERRMAIHLMELFAAEEHLSRIVQALNDPAPEVRRQARRTIASQLQTPIWEEAMIRLLEHEEIETRAQAIQSLSRRRTETARQALQRRLTHESNDLLQEKLKQALETPGHA